jgi:hypothetical protein
MELNPSSERNPFLMVLSVVLMGLVLVALLFMTLVPTLIVPMVVPRSVPVFAQVLCPEEAEAAQTEIVHRSSRRGTSSEWRFHCRSSSGVVTTPNDFRFTAIAYLLYSVGPVLLLVLLQRGYRWLDRRVVGARS